MKILLAEVKIMSQAYTEARLRELLSVLAWEERTSDEKKQQIIDMICNNYEKLAALAGF